MQYIHLYDKYHQHYVDHDNHTFVHWSNYWSVEHGDPANHILVKEDMNSDRFLQIYLQHFNPLKKFISHVFMLYGNKDQPGREIFLTDAVMNIEPTLEQLVHITDNALAFYEMVNSNDEYKLCLVNFLTSNGHLSLKNKTSCNAELLNQYYWRECGIQTTTYQLDCCLYPDALEAKYPGKNGMPDIIVVPNLDTGNAIYKALMKTWDTAGFVIGGINPAILNSRSALDNNPESIVLLEKLLG